MGANSTYIITGGGTGGHVYPGLAIAKALKISEPKCKIQFIGTQKGIESKLVPDAGYEISFVAASGARGLGFIAQIMFVANLVVGVSQSIALFLKYKPKAVIGTGGFVSVPVLLVAFILGYPVFIQEQNSIPGSTNRLLGKYAKRIYLGFNSAKKYFPIGRTLTSGNPVRTEFGSIPARVVGDSINLLVFGGSRGALTINKAVTDAAKNFLEFGGINLHIQTGGIDSHSEVIDAYANFQTDAVTVDHYIVDMPKALEWADIVVCRAGAMTLSELAVAGKPSILVPFPYATDNHQYYNAVDFADAGAAIVIKDDDFNGETMFDAVTNLASDRVLLTEMRKFCLELGEPDSASKIAGDIIKFVNNNNGDSDVS
jgi:UDP-N-acetylglucosamine--N-acetylmuramyl-(pentapeptide) pyrophosphoryl-undecaprenol N-acetylglucosamine transferase